MASSPIPRKISLHPAHPGWTFRGYLPHFDPAGIVQAVTFRLHDAVPLRMIRQWRAELAWVEEMPATDPRAVELRRRIAKYEDAGHGECWLRDERVAGLVERSLLHFDGVRYRLIAWSVMPNHVHVLLDLFRGWGLAAIVHSWKSFTAQRANALLGRSGCFWYREYFDRYIRDREHFENALRYIDWNPVKARLVRSPEEWRFGNAGKYWVR